MRQALLSVMEGDLLALEQEYLSSSERDMHDLQKTFSLLFYYSITCTFDPPAALELAVSMIIDEPGGFCLRI